MKVRLLENVSRPELNGTKGQVLELNKELAEDLERHGYATYALEIEETEAPVVAEDAKEAAAEEEEPAAKPVKKSAARK
jgi:hypothetical protein